MSEIFRPSGAGALTELTPFPDGGEANWEDVDDVSPDEDATYVWAETVSTWLRDLYAIPDRTDSGTIKQVEVFFRIKGTSLTQAKPVIRSWNTGGAAFVITEGTGITLTGSWVTHSQIWTINPADGAAWEDSDFQASGHKLQIGIGLNKDAKAYAQCTQEYVVAGTEIVKVVDETIEIRDKTWTSPTGFEDPESWWNNEANAYDGDVLTRASPTAPGLNGGDTSPWLVLTHAGLLSDIGKFWVFPANSLATWEIEVQYDGDASWYGIWNAVLPWGQEILFTKRGTVTKIRMRATNTQAPGSYILSAVYEVYFGLTSTVLILVSAGIPTLWNYYFRRRVA